MRKSLLVLILILLTAFLLIGCGREGFPAVCCEELWPDSPLSPPDDDWWIFDFPHDSFPGEITLTLHSEGDFNDLETITAVMTNSSASLSHLVMYNQDFALVRRQPRGEWRRVPSNMATIDFRFGLSVGQSHYFIISKECFDLDTHIAGKLYIHGYRFTAGTYRIVSVVSLAHHREYLPSWRHQPIVFWSGPVWVEFDVEE